YMHQETTHTEEFREYFEGLDAKINILIKMQKSTYAQVESLNQGVTEMLEKQELRTSASQGSQEDIFREPLQNILDHAVHSRLKQTVYLLDSIALSLNVSEVQDAVKNSSLFKPYPIDST